MRAFLTGGSGFIGANLVHALNQRSIGVRLLLRSTSSHEVLQGFTYETVSGDILDDPMRLAQMMEGCDWVFHVAAVADYWRQDRQRLYRVNVEGTRNVLRAARQAGVSRFVYTSSLAALGVPEHGKPLREEHTFNVSPRSFPYGHSKALAEDEVRAAAEEGYEAVIVNPSIVLGPRDVNQISGSLIVEAALGRLRFTVPGGANFVDVADVAAGHIAAAEKGRPGERYILGAHNLAYAEAIPIISEVVGRKPPVFSVPSWLLPPAALAVRAARMIAGNAIPADENQVRLMSACIFADCGKALAELTLPQTPFRTTVQRTYNWYNEQGYLDRRE
ncbi:MAG TPA: NAD-dependent epimerase/dehydratase family protein [Candidatus Binatia bacterium]|nr:NAD-dependent epimerase/dehydratase family protein [Candidatus Binatia bacterium]